MTSAAQDARPEDAAAVPALATLPHRPARGSAVERRRVGETVADIAKRFPNWFRPAFAGCAGRVEDLPCDAHVLLAMTAPRPLYVASAIEDTGADPEGEFLAAVAARAEGHGGFRPLKPLESGCEA